MHSGERRPGGPDACAENGGGSLAASIFSADEALARHPVKAGGDIREVADLAKKLGHISGEPKVVRGEADVFERFGLALNESFMPAEERLHKLMSPFLHGPSLEYMWQGD